MWVYCVCRHFTPNIYACHACTHTHAHRESWGSDALLHKVLFFVARPRDEALFTRLRKEAASRDDVVVLAHVWEAYDNITYQTYEMCRVAALDTTATHMAKVG